MRLHCFDIDGTIVNSRNLVRRAYASLGVDVPEHAWGLRWQEWLVDYFHGDEEHARETHEQKVEAYSDLLLRYDLREYELPAARLARRTILHHGTASVRYLTAGSEDTALSIIARLGIAAPLAGGLSYRDRLTYLRRMPHDTIYLDDNLDTISRLTVDAPNLRLVAITNQTYDELSYEVRSLGIRDDDARICHDHWNAADAVPTSATSKH